MNFSEEVTELIIDRMCEGQTLAAICRENGITRRTVYKWLNQHPELRQQVCDGAADARRLTCSMRF